MAQDRELERGPEGSTAQERGTIRQDAGALGAGRGAPRAEGGSDRIDRLAEALRENLRRRKAQARARRPDTAPPGRASDTGDG